MKKVVLLLSVTLFLGLSACSENEDAIPDILDSQNSEITNPSGETDQSQKKVEEVKEGEKKKTTTVKTGRFNNRQWG